MLECEGPEIPSSRARSMGGSGTRQGKTPPDSRSQPPILAQCRIRQFQRSRTALLGWFLSNARKGHRPDRWRNLAQRALRIDGYLTESVSASDDGDTWPHSCACCLLCGRNTTPRTPWPLALFPLWVSRPGVALVRLAQTGVLYGRCLQGVGIVKRVSSLIRGSGVFGSGHSWNPIVSGGSVASARLRMVGWGEFEKEMDHDASKWGLGSNGCLLCRCFGRSKCLRMVRKVQ